MDPTVRFGELVRRPEAELPLDEAALLVAAHDHDVSIDDELRALDDLAAGAPDEPVALARHLFVDLGFVGNVADYADPRNSYLDVVRRRRLGIPISLSVLLLEVGRRRGVALEGVGMPGHFLVRARPGLYLDPFHGGAVLDEDGCRARFVATRGDVPFLPEYLAPVGPRPILARMLANLVPIFLSRAPGAAVWALRLRLLVPGLPPAERRDAARLLGSLGRFADAADELDALAASIDGDSARRLAEDAAALRARGN